jgi:hypothetical protein
MVGPARIFEMAQHNVVFDLEFIVLLLGAGLLVALGLYAALEIRGRFLNREEPVSVATLEHYRELRDQGLLDPAEFERVRVLFERRQEVGRIPEDSRPPDERFRVVDGRVQPPESPKRPEPPSEGPPA